MVAAESATGRFTKPDTAKFALNQPTAMRDKAAGSPPGETAASEE